MIERDFLNHANERGIFFSQGKEIHIQSSIADH